MAILQDISKPTLTLQQQIAELMAENARLRAAKGKQGVTLKVTEKGGVALYGMGRFPVTLYRSQWDKLLANVDQIKGFIEANASSLSVKE